MTIDKENELRQSMNFLFNNWRHNEELRVAFEAIFQKLNSGEKSDKANAAILNKYLSYPGSLSAQSSVNSLLASLNSTEGRKAAGLRRKGRGNKHEPAAVKMEDKAMQVMIAYLLKRVKKWEIDAAILEHMGEDADPKTIRKFRNSLKSRAQTFVAFYNNFQEASASKKPLWDKPVTPQKRENNR